MSRGRNEGFREDEKKEGSAHVVAPVAQMKRANKRRANEEDKDTNARGTISDQCT
jgi:hypothetical protein